MKMKCEKPFDTLKITVSGGELEITGEVASWKANRMKDWCKAKAWWKEVEDGITATIETTRFKTVPKDCTCKRPIQDLQ